MFTRSPIFVRLRSSRFAPKGGASWLWLAPGVSLLVLAVAIMIWPELLAYLVAGALAVAGATLTAWGWAMRRATRYQARETQYRVYPHEVY